MAGGGALEGVDLQDFWADSAYSLESYVEPAPSDELIASIEAEMGGFRLPEAYVKLCRIHNGGIVKRTCYPMDEPTGCAEDHIAITGLYAIGRTATYSLCGPLGAKFMQEEWGYPPIGICIADTPSGGHEQIMLDYRACGKSGEPQVVYVDQEDDYRIVFVAPDFATFLRGLVSEDVYDTSEEDRQRDIAKVEHGTLSPTVQRALKVVSGRLPEGEKVLRLLARQIIEDKGFFALHADERSQLMYAFMFWLYSALRTAESYEDFVSHPEDATSYDVPSYEFMIAFDLVAELYEFKTGGFAEGFVRDWWDARVEAGEIARTSEGYRLNAGAEQALLQRLLSLSV